jgi:chromosome segregation ATPase
MAAAGKTSATLPEIKVTPISKITELVNQTNATSKSLEKTISSSLEAIEKSTNTFKNILEAAADFSKNLPTLIEEEVTKYRENQAKLSEEREQAIADFEALKKVQEQELDDFTYEINQKKRDNKEALLSELAKDFNKKIVDPEEYDNMVAELKSVKESRDSEIKKEVAIAERNVTKSYENQIALNEEKKKTELSEYKFKIQSLEATIESLKETIENYKEQQKNYIDVEKERARNPIQLTSTTTK